jgi:hypothetical protein
MSPDAPLELACFFVPLAVRTTTSPPRTPPVPTFGAPAAPPVMFMWPPMWLPSALAKVTPNIEPAAADPPCSTTFPPAVALLDPAWTRTAPTLNVDWLPLALPPITVTLPVGPAAAAPVPTVAAPVPPTTGLPVADVAEMLPDTPSRLAPLPTTTERRASAEGECGGRVWRASVEGECGGRVRRASAEGECAEGECGGRVWRASVEGESRGR